MAKKDIFLILHNIRSLHNVGSIFRTAECAGVSKIYLTGYTPSPLDVFGKYQKELSKTALGAEKTVLCDKRRDIAAFITSLKKEKIKIIALEQSARATDYGKFRPQFPLILVFGNEVRGLSESILKKCDSIIEIPLYGKKKSLNVAVAAGIALFNLKERAESGK